MNCEICQTALNNQERLCTRCNQIHNIDDAHYKKYNKVLIFCKYSANRNKYNEHEKYNKFDYENFNNNIIDFTYFTKTEDNNYYEAIYKNNNNNTIFYIFMKGKYKPYENHRFIGSTVNVIYQGKERINEIMKHKYIFRINTIKDLCNTIVQKTEHKSCQYVAGCFNFLNLKIQGNLLNGVIPLKEMRKMTDDEFVEQYISIFSDISKFICLIKPTQSRKTQEIIEYSENFLNEDKNNKIIQFVDNSILQSKQFSYRMNNNGNVITKVLLSCKHKDKVELHNSKDYEDMINNFDNFGCLLVLKNKKRLNNIYTLLTLMEKKILNNEINNYKININIDEIDASISSLQNDNLKILLNDDIKKKYNIVDRKISFFDFIKESSIINNVLLITATPKRLFDIFQKNNMKMKLYRPLNGICSEEYYNKFANSTFTFIKEKTKTFNNFKDTLDDIIKNIKKEDNIIFCPASSAQKTHHAIKDIFLENDYNVILLNGSDKKIIRPGKSEIDLNEYKTDNELSEILPEIKKKYKIKNIAITGKFCIGRGVTFFNKGFELTHAIFGDYLIGNECEAYQMIGRITGNFKYHNNNFNGMEVYCSEDFKTKMCIIEKITFEYTDKYFEYIDRHADNYNKERKNNILEEKNKMYEMIFEEYYYGIECKIIKDIQKDIKNYTGKNYKIKERKRDSNNFIMESFANNEINSSKVYTLNELKNALQNITIGSHLTFKNNNIHYRAYFFYTIEGDIDSLGAYLKIVKKI